MKMFLLTLFIVAMLCASSCAKDNYTCQCTTSGGTNGGYKVENESLGKMSSADANNECSSWENEQQAALSNAGGTATVSCYATPH